MNSDVFTGLTFPAWLQADWTDGVFYTTKVALQMGFPDVSFLQMKTTWLILWYSLREKLDNGFVPLLRNSHLTSLLISHHRHAPTRSSGELFADVFISLQWHHNKHDGVSNHRRLDYLLNRLCRRRSKKTSKLRITGLCVGNSPVTVAFSARRKGR